MKTKNKIILELKAKHFEDTEFLSIDCAIVKAYEGLTGNHCSEGVDMLRDLTTDVDFKHKRYGNATFEKDQKKAESHNWNDTVIRTIELIEQ